MNYGKPRLLISRSPIRSKQSAKGTQTIDRLVYVVISSSRMEYCVVNSVNRGVHQ